jgi:hypothetical protein
MLSGSARQANLDARPPVVRMTVRAYALLIFQSIIDGQGNIQAHGWL